MGWLGELLIEIIFYILIFAVFLGILYLLVLGIEQESPPLIILPGLLLLLIISLFIKFPHKILILAILVIIYLFYLIIYYSFFRGEICKICKKRKRGKKIRIDSSGWYSILKRFLKKDRKFLLIQEDEVICSDCYEIYFKCEICHNIVVDKEYFTDENKAVCVRCYNKLKRKQKEIISLEKEKYVICDGCGVVVVKRKYQYLSSRRLVLCEKCQKLPICDCCNKIIKEKPIKIHTRIICESCFGEIGIDNELLLSMAKSVREIMAKNLSMEIYHNITIRLVDEEEMIRIKGFLCWGIFIRGNKFEVLILKSLTKRNIYKVMAHEYTHAWQAENCPSSQTKRFLEGFAEWVAYKVLNYLGEKVEAQRMETGMWGEYLEGFKKFLELEKIYGVKYIIKLVKTSYDF